MSDAKTKKAFIVRDFNDAGTETNYTAGAVVLIEEGAFANYKAAGLVRAPTPEELKAGDTTAAAADTKADTKPKA